MVFGVLLGLLGTEICLQLAAAVRAAGGRPVPSLTAGSGRTILCVGDSNTYGLHLDAEDSYPSQLQRLLGDSAHVINLVFPGMNSSRVRAELGQTIDAVQADVVLILVGANDFWTAPPPRPDDPWTAHLMHWSRTYRLLYMLWRGVASTPVIDVPRLPKDAPPEDLEVTARVGGHAMQLGWKAQGQRHWQSRFTDNLAAIVATAHERGAQPIVLTYPSDAPVYRAINVLIGEAARPLSVPVIDLHERFKALCPAVDCERLIFTDGHPTAAGYGEVAATIAAWLEQRPQPPGT